MAWNWDEADRAVARAIADRHAALGRPVLIGLAGAQGSGKSTMAPRIAAQLVDRGLRTAILALDDFYLTRAERQELARTVHPMLATRGVPGTHDVECLSKAIDALLAGQSATVPRFDKALDDRDAIACMVGPADVLILEGWCIGARPQSDVALATPVNVLEHDEDPDSTWRRWVNKHLGSDYAPLFARLDLTVLLRAPDFSVVERWRSEQEAHLGARGMGTAAIARFVAHYERITRGMLASPAADFIVDLDEARQPTGWSGRPVH